MTLIDEYNKKYHLLQMIADSLQSELVENLKGLKHIDRISTRPKKIDRFIQKALKKEKDGNPKYTDPMNQIQDQVGARVVVFYLDDLAIIEKELLKYYNPIEQQLIYPDSEKEFGYEGKHFIFLIPSDVLPAVSSDILLPIVFELQIKTLYQHAFSEASHDLAYKSDAELTRDQKRKVAFTSAQSSGADNIFSQLVKELCG